MSGLSVILSAEMAADIHGYPNAYTVLPALSMATVLPITLRCRTCFKTSHQWPTEIKQYLQSTLELFRGCGLFTCLAQLVQGLGVRSCLRCKWSPSLAKTCRQHFDRARGSGLAGRCRARSGYPLGAVSFRPPARSTRYGLELVRLFCPSPKSIAQGDVTIYNGLRA